MPIGSGEQIIFKIRTLVFKETRLIMGFLVIGFLSNTMALGNSKIEYEKLLTRESIIRHTKKELIKKNRNIEFDNLFQIKVVLEGSSVECFFGYQNKQRLVLCY